MCVCFLPSSLQTQLRNQLIQELKHPLLGGGGETPFPGPLSTRPPDSLLVSASNTIVADYLKSSGHEYTLSVFYPESGLRKDKVTPFPLRPVCVRHICNDLLCHYYYYVIIVLFPRPFL